MRKLHLKMYTPEGKVDIVPVTSEEHFAELLSTGYKKVPVKAGGDTPQDVLTRAEKRGYRAPQPITFAGSVRFYTSRARS
jgi:hypothetical protein